ncbi:hypothetical protein C8Q80DRAFT_1128917 [Daedaleopsis nitida]|nr:hypothetical protein C8Q80DRAFT_1128917 [Daedaleopsis nitida]
MYTPHPEEPHGLENSTESTTYLGLGPNASGIIDASFVLTTIGQFALLLLFATLVYNGFQQRSAISVNMPIVTFIATFPPYLLVYGTALWEQHPPASLCVTQAALVDGAGTMLSLASLALVVDLLIEIRLFAPPVWSIKYTQALLVMAPYMVFLVFSYGASALGVAHPDQVQHMPNELACSLRNTAFAIGMQIIIVLTLTTTFWLEIYAIVSSIRTRHQLSGQCRRSLTTSQALRIIGFTFLQAFLLILGALDVYVPSPRLHVVSITYQALMPLGTFVAFGMTEDCIRVWKKWAFFARCRRATKQNGSRSRDLQLQPVQVQVTVEKHTGDLIPIAITMHV